MDNRTYKVLVENLRELVLKGSMTEKEFIQAIKGAEATVGR